MKENKEKKKRKLTLKLNLLAMKLEFPPSEYPEGFGTFINTKMRVQKVIVANILPFNLSLISKRAPALGKSG